MNKLRDKIKTKSFWVSVAGMLALLLARSGVLHAEAVATAIVEGIGGVLIALGIIAAPPATPQESESEESEKDDKDEKED
ncbi:MAG: hypothetical protein K2M95_06490 [Clostridiales bacterium]|nr:hypothetical protein [Clostridiales bacterium]